MSDDIERQGRGEIILYNTQNGVNIEVRLQNDSVWLTLNQMADLYGIDKSGISKHLKNIYEELELQEDRTVAKFATVQKEGDRSISRNLEHYNLEAIIAVGYRVRSTQGTAFRRWATNRLKEFIIKGFVLDDERLKNDGDNRYFKELLQRIRDIRSSEKVIWRQVLDIFATSIDYDKTSETAILLFKVIQNKMHYAAHNHTAAEIVYSRADSLKPNMGMTNFKGNIVTKAESIIAKNYLNEEEIKNLNAIVSAIFEFAEAQALNHIPMKMRDWISKFDALIKLNDRSILVNMGKISHESAVHKAYIEYDKYKKRIASEESEGEKDFHEVIEKIKKLEDSLKKTSTLSKKKKK